jgi:predicted AAA+ superfamily ATPase
MDQKAFFEQAQQFGNEWLKLVTEQTQRFTVALGEAEKLEKRAMAQAVSAIEESGRVAKEALVASEQLTAQWRKSAQDAAQRAVELFTTTTPPATSSRKA